MSGNYSLCSRCRESSHYLNSISSWAEYEDPLRQAILSLKYKQNIGLAETFSSFLILLLKQKSLEFDLVVPIPLGSTRRKQRGFNQAELLARPLSLYFGIQLSGNAVRRIKETDSQVKLSAKERSLNMEGAFFGNTAKLKGRSVLLVDDIITTGATMNHCAKAILESGARCVDGISVAKTM